MVAELRAQHQAGAGSPLAHCQASSGISLQRLRLVTAVLPGLVASKTLSEAPQSLFCLNSPKKCSVFPTERSEGFATSPR